MIKAAEVDIDVNLLPLSRLLWGRGIAHRINEQSGLQVIWVGDAQEAAAVDRLVQEFLGGRLDVSSELAAAAVNGPDGGDRQRRASVVARILWAIWKAPVSASLILLCAIVAVMTRFGSQAYRLEFLFYPSLPVDSVTSLLASIDSIGVLLRTLAPILLHFGELHIIFNLLWLWFFGRQLEVVQSSWVFLGVVLATAFVGNTYQYLYTGAANFGGMSGVVYGLVGYAWILHQFVPGKRLLVNDSIFVVFLVALVLMEVFASSWIATAAHAGGLVTGVLAGLAVWFANRLARGPRRRES